MLNLHFLNGLSSPQGSLHSSLLQAIHVSIIPKSVFSLEWLLNKGSAAQIEDLTVEQTQPVVGLIQFASLKIFRKLLLIVNNTIK